MQFLCDTNILIRSIKLDDPHHQQAVTSLSHLHAQGHEPLIVPQCCYEFYVVATRPTQQNGLGISPDEALADITDFCSLYRLLRDERVIFETWRDIIGQQQILGKQAHDARLVAAMKRHHVTHILTFNQTDFSAYPGVTVLTPAGVLSSPP